MIHLTLKLRNGAEDIGYTRSDRGITNDIRTIINRPLGVYRDRSMDIRRRMDGRSEEQKSEQEKTDNKCRFEKMLMIFIN